VGRLGRIKFSKCGEDKPDCYYIRDRYLVKTYGIVKRHGSHTWIATCYETNLSYVGGDRFAATKHMIEGDEGWLV
jgi:hypothetical protein